MTTKYPPHSDLPSCGCAEPAVTNMDHDQYDFITRQSNYTVNRMCRRCGTHWYGSVKHNQIKQYSRRAWDNWINS